jgi:hypothetical protein
MGEQGVLASEGTSVVRSRQPKLVTDSPGEPTITTDVNC